MMDTETQSETFIEFIICMYVLYKYSLTPHLKLFLIPSVDYAKSVLNMEIQYLCVLAHLPDSLPPIYQIELQIKQDYYVICKPWLGYV